MRTWSEMAATASQRRGNGDSPRFEGFVYRGDLERAPVFLYGSAENLTGYREEDLRRGDPKWSQVIHPDDFPAFRASGSIDRDSGFIAREYRIVRKDGQMRWVLEIIQNVRDERGTSLFMQGVVHDITPRRQVFEALRASEARYRSIVELANEGIWEIDAGQRTTFVNRIMAEMLGYEAIEMLGRPPRDFIFPEDHDDYQARMELMRQNLGDRFECRLRRKDGSPLWAMVSVTGLTDEANRFAGGFGMFMDISERKRWEEALQEAEFKYRMVADNTHDWEFWTSPDGRIIYNSPSCERLTGYQTGDFQRDQDLLSRIVHPSDRKRFVTFHASEAKRLRPTAIEFRLQHADGSERWIEQLCFPVQGNDGELLGIRGSNRDVTRRRQTEEELRNHRENLERLVEERTSELQRTNEALQREVVERRLVREALQATDEQLAAIIEFLPDATLVVDCQKRIIAWNRAIEEMTGVKKEQIIGKGDHAYSIPFYGSPQPMLIDLLMGGGREVAARYEAVTVKGNTVFGEEWVSMTGDRREACLWVTASLLFDRRGELLGAIQAIRDVTERSRAQDALLNSEKQLRALSSQLLTAQEEERKRIAQELHDSIGQSLAALKFNVENVRLALLRGAQVSALDTLAELVPKIQQVMEEARRIYMGLRPSMLDDLGIIATIGWCCREFQTTCPETRIETHLEVTEEDVAEALKIVIFRIIQEALNNVFKHSRAKHAVLTLTRTRTRLEVAIQDDGSGFDHDVMARNGDPGRGMGIRGMKERAETSGGLFELTSNPGKGTTVKASWPLEAGC